MNLQQIKKAVSNGDIVHWKNSGYTVKQDRSGQFNIVFHSGDTIGLTWLDGETLNGDEKDFYLGVKDWTNYHRSVAIK